MENCQRETLEETEGTVTITEAARVHEVTTHLLNYGLLGALQGRLLQGDLPASLPQAALS